MRKIEASGWAILCFLSLGALVFSPLAFAGGIALGGLLALGNFRCMDVYFARLFRRDGSRPKWWHHALYAGRFIGLMAAVAVALAWAGLPAMSLVLGLSVPPMAIFLHGALALMKGDAGGWV